VYGAMAVSRPILFFGPRPSHVADLLDRHDFGVHVSHGDTAAAVRAIEAVAATPRSRLDQMGATAQHVLRQRLSQDLLCGEFCDRVELTLHAK
jgi:colanic acid biosynthesis glycosyl transferase WcaI